LKTWSTPVSSEEARLIPCALCGGAIFKPSLSCEGFSYVRCVACNLVQINPQPLETAIQRRYGKNYLSYELDNEAAFLDLQQRALSDAGFDHLEQHLFADNTARKPRVLDIGCATGSLLLTFKERGWETTGVEISGAQAEYCRTTKKLDVRNLPLSENRFDDESFDVVLASHVIEHLNDPGAFVAEVRRILNPEGRFFVTTPNISGFQARLFSDKWRSAIFDHLYLFSVQTLSRLLTDKGFTVEKVAVWGGLAAGTVPRPLKRLVDKAAKRFGFGDVMIVRSAKNRS